MSRLTYDEMVYRDCVPADLTVEDMRRRTGRSSLDAEDIAGALHEAAHAIVAMALRYRVTEVKLWRSGRGWHGHVAREPIAAEQRAQRDALITVAGYAAMGMVEGRIRDAEARLSGGWYRLIDSDRQDFDRVWRSLGYDSKRTAQEAAAGTARKFLYTHHDELRALLGTLLRRTEGGTEAVLSEAELQTVCGELATRWQADAPPVRARPASTGHTSSPMAIKMTRRPEREQRPANTRPPARFKEVVPPTSDAAGGRGGVSAGGESVVPDTFGRGVRWAYPDGRVVLLRPGDPWPA